MKKIFNAAKFTLILCLFLLIASGNIESSDGVSALNVSRNIVREGKFNIAPEQWSTGIQSTKGRDGQYYSPTSLGTSLVYLPSALVTESIYKLNNFEGAKYFPLQSDYLLTFLASFTNPILGFLLFIINYKIFKIFTKNKNQAFFLSFIISFATNLLPLSKHSFSHILFSLTFMTSLYYLLIFKNKKIKKNLILSGVFFGLAILSYNLIFIPILLIYLIFMFFYLSKNLKQIYTWLLSLVPFVAVFLWYNYFRFGSIFTTGYDVTEFDLTTKGVLFEGVWGLIFSPGRSFILYSPVLLISYILAIRNYKKEIFSKFFIWFTLFLVFFYGSFVFWHGELSWGPRYLSVIIPFAGIVLAQHIREISTMFLYVLIFAGIIIQVEGTVLPYQIQYFPAYDLEVFYLPKEFKRSTQFAYWSIGEFIPRYAPIYRMKKNLALRILQFKDVFAHNNKIVFANNVSLPQKDNAGSSFKRARSNFYIFATDNLSFQETSFDLRNSTEKIESLVVCSNKKCSESDRLQKNRDLYSFYFKEKINLERNRYVKFEFKSVNSKSNNFELNIYGFSLDKHNLSMNDYRLATEDAFFSRNTPFFYNGSDLKRYWLLKAKDQEVINETSDFWWTKVFVYYNLPIYFKTFFVLLLSTASLCVLVLISRFRKHS